MRVIRRLLFQQLLHRGVGEGAIPFPGLLHFTLDTYLIIPSVKQGCIKYHVLSMTRLGIRYRSPGPFANTLPTRSILSEWLNSSIWSIKDTLTGTITPSQGEPESNGNKGSISPSPDFQNWSLTIRYSLVSYLGHPLMKKSLTIADWDSYLPFITWM